MRTSGRALLAFGTHIIDFARVQVGDLVWKNKDPALEAKLSKIADRGDVGLVPVSIRVSGREGQAMSITIESAERNQQDGTRRILVGSAETQVILAPALRQPLTRAVLLQALGTLGDTPFSLNEQDISVEDSVEGLFVPVQEVKAARREAVRRLLLARGEHERDGGIGDEDVLPAARTEAMRVASQLGQAQAAQQHASSLRSEPFSLTCLCRTPEQTAAACAVPWLQEITLDFLEVHGLRENVALVKKAGKRCVVGTPRILKPEEERLYTFYLRLRADAILVRSAGFLQQLSDLGGPGTLLEGTDIPIPELHGDFSLNSANLLSTAIFLNSGISRLCASHDLNANQISDLGTLLGDSSMLEVIIYQHLPIFHTEHCVFCRFLSDGNSFLDCGKPCESNRVHLRGVSDGLDHLVLADQGCRNTVFNAVAQSGAEYVGRFQDAGIGRFRLEFVDEPAASVGPLLEHYRDVCLGIDGAQSRLAGLLKSVPNGNGAAQGYSAGSLLPKLELGKSQMKTTAAEKKNGPMSSRK